MTRALWLLAALSACMGYSNSPPNTVFDIDVAWQVRCPDCTYPEHAINGTIDTADNPNWFDGWCTISKDNAAVSVFFGQDSHPEGQQQVPGYDLNVTLGYDPSTGFDLARQCHAMAAEPGGVWEATCSDTGDCHIEPTLADGALSFTMRCAGMTPYLSHDGPQVTLEGPDLAGDEISASIGPCSTTSVR